MILSHRNDLIALNSSVTRSETSRVMLDETALGNMFAFSCLYDELATETYSLCLRIVETRGQADKAALETWLRVWQHAASLTQASSPAREPMLVVAVNVGKWVKSNG
jgi:DNA-directed RNA polymerase specialized sigma24 family protein